MSGGLRHLLVSEFWTYRFSYCLLRPIQFLIAGLLPRLQDLFERFRRPRKSDDPAWLMGTAHICPTLACNARCVFCAYSPRLIAGHTVVMPQTLFRKAVDDLVALKVGRLSLIPFLGEILTDEGIFERIAYVRSRGLAVSTFSNGVLLQKNDNIRRLLESGVDDLSISLSDLDPAIEAENYGISLDSARQKMEGVERLLRENEGGRKIPRLCLSFRPSRNPHLITRHPLFKLVRESGCEYSFLLKLDNWGGQVVQERLKGIMRLVSPRRVRKRPCSALRSFSIHPDGNVRLCGCRVGTTLDDDLVIGNINDQPLGAILQGPKTATLRRRYFNGDLPEVCVNCGYFEPERSA